VGSQKVMEHYILSSFVEELKQKKILIELMPLRRFEPAEVKYCQ